MSDHRSIGAASKSSRRLCVYNAAARTKKMNKKKGILQTDGGNLEFASKIQTNLKKTKNFKF